MTPHTALLYLFVAALAVAPLPSAAATDAPLSENAPRCDFNGDGFDDLAVRLPGFDVEDKADAGAVDIFYGSASGLRAVDSRRVTRKIVPGGAPRSGDLFGFSTACDDLQKDGYSDLLIGAPGVANARGKVFLIPGSAAGLRPRDGTPLALSPGKPEARFGAAVAFGNIGTQTPQRRMVVGAPGTKSGRGSVFLLTADVDQSPVRVDNPTTTRGFGSNVVAGDVDHDGSVDLVVAAPSGGRGSVVALFEVRQSGAFGSHERLSPRKGSSPRRFGSSIAVGDLGNDGRNEIIIGDPRHKNGAGVVEIWSLGTSGEMEDRIKYGRAGLGLVNPDASAVGASVVVDDFDGNGMPGLITGLPTRDQGARRDTGMIAILYDAPATAHTTAVSLSQDSAGMLDEAEENDLFGSALASGDFNGDGFADLAAYAPGDHGRRPYAGHVHIVPGSASGLNTDADRKLATKSAGESQREAYFAWSVATTALERRAGPSIAIEALTSVPDHDSESGSALHDRLVDLVERADDDSEILIAQYRIRIGTGPVTALLDELQEAKDQRGIDVRFTLDHTIEPAVVVDLEARGFPVTVCTTNCLGGDDGAQHNKYMTLSSVDGIPTLATSTANWSGTGMGDSFEAMLVVREFDPESTMIYDTHRARYLDFETERLPESEASGRVRHAGLAVRLFPQATGDPIAGLLDRVDIVEGSTDGTGCRYTTAAGVDKRTEIRIAVSRGDDKRLELIERIIELHQAGCRVQIFAGDGAIPLLDALEEGGFPVSADGTRPQNAAGAWCIADQHSKEITVRGPFDGKVAKIGWMGTHNLERGNLRNTADVWYRIDDPAVHKTLRDNMASMFDFTQPCPPATS